MHYTGSVNEMLFVHLYRDLPWVPVAGCVLVKHPLVCDLTRAFTNPTHVYYSMVVAILESQASPGAYSTGFKPIKDGKWWPRLEGF